MKRDALLQESKNMILWSLLLSEEEKGALLEKIETFTDGQLQKLQEVLKTAQQKENNTFDILGKIDPDITKKIKNIVKTEKKKMLQEAEKQEGEEATAEELLQNL